MNDFSIYLELGWKHILDLNGSDHILFILSLIGVYLFRDWRKVLVLVTAFTIGHSATLALSVFEAVQFRSALIELLIPITIVITALFNLLRKNRTEHAQQLKYGAALLFGLIHGLGFSGYLKSLLGADENIVMELLAFNLGLELGQLVVVTVVLSLAHLFVKVKVKQADWSLFLSAATFGAGMMMVMDRLPAL
ncbi:HupE/UreJ family protein [Pedobacter sp. SYSU D00535]|uniref:HupE/UreJ family protein n=1 Tax=Pedobacter sp. SYSU D00535 TaxID=2810308 RepID=UPI001A9670B8|nr:HupE/UreJ family protein [Pedobacter sp. SYSU D00535]